ncbi:MAG: bifunctional homocysteine S-methyltransferase/methylenetetrahydrofolate reductase [Pedosphaera sp.]|nr:bifunctional homocysteine S-methyltransferase/methylenetetrahydrofolate reductase [Pedosphaera sp.]
MSKFLDKLSQGVLVGDGAMGTLIYSRGIPLNVCFDELSVSQPEFIRRIHEEYVGAGANMIETNTFGANRYKLAKHGLDNRVNEINWKAARLAKEVAGKEVFVAGSVGPLNIPADSEDATHLNKEELFREQIGALLDGGCDVIMLETFADLSEIKIALRAFQSVTDKPVICSISVNDEGFLQSGVSVADAFAQLREAGADVVGINCLVGPRGALSALARVPVDEQSRILVNPNAGRPELVDGRYVYLSTPEYCADMSVKLVSQGARIVGGCCGTTPEHIHAIAQALRQVRPITSKTVVITERPVPKPEKLAPPQETILDIIKKRTLIVTELDPPRTLEFEKIIEGAKALKAAGTDSLTLADNSLAVVRMSNVAMGSLIKDQAGIIPLIHISCRDRNLIGTQSELMGMAALGLDHVLAITGDPAKVGDAPEASSVYDLNSISLIELIAKFNQGFMQSGRQLKRTTRFVIGCSFNPNVKNIDVQVKRLERKLKAGAQYVMTQPIYDHGRAKEVHDATKHFGVPILVGVMPLLNARNCEFLHNEVPGIEIPQTVRDRMRGKEGPDGIKEGLAVAREVTAEVLTYFKGIYLITPMVKYEMTVELSRYIRAAK